MPTATARSFPGLHGPCTTPAPCTAQELLGHQIKHPKGFQGRRGFISGFPETFCHPTGEQGLRPGQWQSTAMREDAPHLTEGRIPLGLAHRGVPGHPQCQEAGCLGGASIPEIVPWPRAPSAAWGFAFYPRAPVLPRLPWVPSDAPWLPRPLGVPRRFACPSSVTGTLVPLHSPATLRALRMRSGPASSGALQAIAPHVLFFAPKSNHCPQESSR